MCGTALSAQLLCSPLSFHITKIRTARSLLVLRSYLLISFLCTSPSLSPLFSFSDYKYVTKRPHSVSTDFPTHCRYCTQQCQASLPVTTSSLPIEPTDYQGPARMLLASSQSFSTTSEKQLPLFPWRMSSGFRETPDLISTRSRQESKKLRILWPFASKLTKHL